LQTDELSAGLSESQAARLRELGDMLRRTREDKQISVETAVEATKVRGRYLQAIEAGDLSVLPGKVYARGFIRGYADYLGLSGADLTNLYLGVARDEELPRAVQGASSQSKREADDGLRSRSTRRYVKNQMRPVRDAAFGKGLLKVAGVIVVFTILVVAYAALSHQQSQVSVQPPASGTTTKGNPTTGKSASGGNGKTHVQAPSTVRGGGKSVSATHPAVGAIKPILTKMSSVQNAETFAVATPGRFTLALSSPNGRCWIETTVDGKVVASTTMSQGQKLTWSAGQQLSIVLGNVPAVKMLISGVVVPLAPANGGYTYTFIKQSSKH